MHLPNTKMPGRIGVFSFLTLLSLTLTPVLVQGEESASDLKKDISSVEKKLKSALEKKAALERELAAINSTLSATQRAIAEAEIKIKQAANDIERKQAEIELLEKQVEEQSLILSGLMQDLYLEGALPLPRVFLASTELSEVLHEPVRLMTVQEKIKGLLATLKDTKGQTENERATLETIRSTHQTLLETKVAERQELAADQRETHSDLTEQLATVEELQEKLQELRSDLSALTGKSFSAKDIKEAVEYASKETGVPKGVLYGFLKMETNLGANTGQCTYDQVKKDAMSRYYSKNKKKYKNSIALLERRYDIFLDIVDELGYSKSKKVSCTPRSYVGQGGAMGVSQFMADTWRAYESEIRSKTGSKDPDPWDLADGVMGLALKVRKAGGTSDSSSAIRKASINYLGAFNTNYYNGIVYWSKNYKRLFN